MSGVSYEGYEQVITVLLRDIEGRHLQKKPVINRVQKRLGSGKKGSRELKRMASSMNYEVRVPRVEKGKGQLQLAKRGNLQQVYGATCNLTG